MPTRGRTVPAALLLSACVLPVGQQASGPEEVQPGEVALDYAGAGDAVLTVPVMLNGKGPYVFVVDTGATLTCVDRQLAEELALPDRKGVIGQGATLGGAGRMRVVEIASVGVGTARATGVTGCVVDLQNVRAVGPEVRGLLGLSFLRSYRVVLDFPRKALRLDRPGGGG